MPATGAGMTTVRARANGSDVDPRDKPGDDVAGVGYGGVYWFSVS